MYVVTVAVMFVATVVCTVFCNCCYILSTICVKVDGMSVMLPHRGLSGVDIHMYRGTTLRLRTDTGLSVTMDARGKVTVRLPLMYR